MSRSREKKALSKSYAPGGGSDSDGSSERPERKSAKQQSSRRVQRPLTDFARHHGKQCNLCAATDLCPLSENLRPIPTEVPLRGRTACSVTKVVNPLQETPNRRCGMLPEVRIRLFLQCDPAGRRPAKIQFRKIRSSTAAEERKPNRSCRGRHQLRLRPPAHPSAGRGLTKEIALWLRREYFASAKSKLICIASGFSYL